MHAQGKDKKMKSTKRWCEKTQNGHTNYDTKRVSQCVERCLDYNNSRGRAINITEQEDYEV